MSPDFWWGALTGFAAFIGLLIAATVIAALVLARGAAMEEERVYTGRDADRFLRDLNEQ